MTKGDTNGQLGETESLGMGFIAERCKNHGSYAMLEFGQNHFMGLRK